MPLPIRFPLLFSVFICLLPTGTMGACLPPDLAPDLEAQVAAAELVAHVKLITNPPETIQLPCGISVFDEPGTLTYIIQDEFPAYQVLELFKGDLNGTNEIAIAWWTDTGYRVNMPDYITDDDTGFLAIMDSYRICNSGTFSSFPYPDDYTPIPYTAGECTYGNQRWSTVSEQDKAWLRSLAVSPGVTSPTAEPSGFPTIVDEAVIDTSLAPTTQNDLSSSLSPSSADTGTGAPFLTEDSPLTGSDAVATSSASSLSLLVRFVVTLFLASLGVATAVMVTGVL